MVTRQGNMRRRNNNGPNAGNSIGRKFNRSGGPLLGGMKLNQPMRKMGPAPIKNYQSIFNTNQLMDNPGYVDFNEPQPLMRPAVQQSNKPAQGNRKPGGNGNGGNQMKRGGGGQNRSQNNNNNNRQRNGNGNTDRFGGQRTGQQSRSNRNMNQRIRNQNRGVGNTNTMNNRMNMGSGGRSSGNNTGMSDRPQFRLNGMQQRMSQMPPIHLPLMGQGGGPIPPPLNGRFAAMRGPMIAPMGRPMMSMMNDGPPRRFGGMGMNGNGGGRSMNRSADNGNRQMRNRPKGKPIQQRRNDIATGGGGINSTNGGKIMRNRRRPQQKGATAGQPVANKRAKQQQNVDKYPMDKPWVTPEIRESFDKKCEIQNRLKGHRDDQLFAEFKVQRDKFVQLYEAAQLAHIGKKATKTKDNDKTESNETDTNGDEQINATKNAAT